MASIADSKVAALLAQRANRGYPTSYNRAAYGSGGLNLTDMGWPSSTEGFQGTSIAQALATMPSNNKTSNSSAGSISSARSYANDYNGGNASDAYIQQLEEQLRGYQYDAEERQKDRDLQDKWRQEEREDRKREREEDRKEREEEKKKKSDAYTKALTKYQKNKINRKDFYKKEKKNAKNNYKSSSNVAKKNYNSTIKSLKKILAGDQGTAKKNYDTESSRLKTNYETTLKNLLGDYTNSTEKLNKQAEDSLKQAYINNMLAQRNIGQQLAAQGINGGASESAMLRLNTNYGNSRNNINTNLASNLRDIENEYNKNKANEYTNYNNQTAEALKNYNTLLGEAQKSYNQNQLAALNNWNDTKLALLTDKNKAYTEALRNYQNNLSQDQSDYYTMLLKAAENGVSAPSTTKKKTVAVTPTVAPKNTIATPAAKNQMSSGLYTANDYKKRV